MFRAGDHLKIHTRGSKLCGKIVNQNPSRQGFRFTIVLTCDIQMSYVILTFDES
jgi:hypothetical protein